MTARVLALLLVLGVVSSAAAQEAVEGDVAAAADAFMRGQQAELRGDWADAAQLYALADQIAPSPEALRSAARAAREAGLGATAATHAALLLSRTPVSAESRALADEILRAHEHDLARIEARCASACRVTIDGRLISGRATTDHVVYARPGERRLRASFGPGRNGEEHAVTLRAGETSVVELGAAASAVAATTAAHDEGLSPWFFGGGVLLTAIAGGLAIWSGVDVMNAHATYDRSAADAEIAFQHGRDLELRTDVLFAVTGALALTTVILAVFTDWDGSPSVDHAARLRDLPLASVGDGSFSVGWRHVLE